MNNALRKAALLASLALSGCGPEKLAGGTGAGNPPLADVSLSVQASSGAAPAAMKAAPLRKASKSVTRNPDGTFSVADSAGNALTLTAIEVRIQKIEFTLPTGATCWATAPFRQAGASSCS